MITAAYAADAATNSGAASGGFVILGLLAAGYMFPWIIALLRKHHNSGAIFALNLFFGWTVLGWFGALIWSFTNPPATVVIQQAEAVQTGPKNYFGPRKIGRF